jgi:GT2 family glycosyltransferase
MAARKVSIIILTWNGLAYTRRCLDTLHRNTEHDNHEVLVVDNGSTDGTVEYLRCVGWIRLVENGSNLGFVKGNNRGMALVGPDADVVLLNNDVEIHQPDWLVRLQESAYRAEDIGIAGCRLRHPTGPLLHAGAWMPPDTWWGQQIGGGEDDVNQYSADRDVEHVVFACVYLKRAVIDRIGMLDEDYFSYFEDVDYCLKAREAGFRIVCCGSATIDHHENISTTINRVSHNKMFLRSQEVFKRKWRTTIERQRYQQHLDWRSIINFPSGYGVSSRQFVYTLDRLGVEIAYRYVYGPGTPFPLPEPRTDDYLVNLVQRRPLRRDGVQVVYGQGDVFERNDGAYRIGFTMLETDGIPEEWVRQANRMDEVWVPSTFNVQTFTHSGVRKPIHVVPLGVDPHYFHPGIRGYRSDRVFTFLSVFEWGERKAPEVLLSAFSDEFSARDDVVLLCKITNRDGSINVHEEVQRMNLRRGGGRIVLSVNDTIPAYQLGCLYRSADCLVLASRGEGWGMPILEAMACGLPVIATDWSAPCDFFNATNGYPLQVQRLVPAKAKCPYYEGFCWAEPSHDHLRHLLRHVVDHAGEAREKGLRAAEEVRAKWTWEHSARRILERLRSVAGSGTGAVA